MVRRLSVVGLLAVALVGCSQPTEEEASAGGSAQTGQGRSFASQMTTCDEASARAFDQAVSTADMIQAAAEESSCFRAILDNNAPRIDAIRAAAGGMQLAPRTLRAAAAFEAFRNGKGTRALCDVLDDASPNYGGTLQRVERVACDAGREKQLARLAASWVAWEDGTRSRIDERGSAESLRARVPALVDLILENDPSRDRAATTAAVTSSIDGTIQAAGDLCLLLADAGEMGGGTGARLQLNGCNANALGLLDKELAGNLGVGETR